MSSWIEEELNLLQLYQDQTLSGDILLPQHAVENVYELDSDFRPQELQSLSSSRSGNFFSSRVQAAMYGQALAIMLKLRHAPGNVIFSPGVYVVTFDTVEGERTEVFAQETLDPVFSISGYFISNDYAESAIQTIGMKQLIIAYRTLMCIR